MGCKDCKCEKVKLTTKMALGKWEPQGDAEAVEKSTRNKWARELIEEYARDPEFTVSYICSGDRLIIAAPDGDLGVQIFDCIITRSQFVPADPDAYEGP